MLQNSQLQFPQCTLSCSPAVARSTHIYTPRGHDKLRRHRARFTPITEDLPPSHAAAAIEGILLQVTRPYFEQYIYKISCPLPARADRPWLLNAIFSALQ